MAMNAKQLTEAGSLIIKAVEGGDPPSTLLSLLKPLESFTATEMLLRQSKIGLAVNRLRQHKDQKVAEVATRTINRWKADVKAKKPSGAAGGSPAPSTTAKVNGTSDGRNGTSSPAPAPRSEAKSSQKRLVAPEKRSADADKVDCAVTGNSQRDSCLKLIYNGLSFMSEEEPEEILQVAQKVEMAAYNEFQPETSSEYKAKIRSLFMNLKMKENGDLRRDVFGGSIPPTKFVKMTSDELKSAEKRAQDAALEKENMNKAMTAQEEKAISTTMTCGKCKQSRVAYSQAQTRSADEPMTTFCECTNCGNRWKFS